MDEAEPLYIVNVEGAIFHNGRYLIAVRGPGETHATGLSALIGGKLEGVHERLYALEDTLRREIREEVDLEVGEMVYLYSNVFGAADAPVLDVIFLCRYQSGQALAMDPDEVAALYWLTPEQIAADKSSPPWLLTQIEQAEAMRQRLGW
ncbi:MAG: NUDIX domain-containing protein [Anaerolineae bacterium]|nr:NUDIX domain-containing protein [Anaerolineae bacterium]